MDIRVLTLEGNNPREWGRQQGETFKHEIPELYKIRLGLTLERTNFENEDEILRVADAHVPIMEAFDWALTEELRGVADESGLSLGQVILLNHYTDFRDLNRKVLDTLPSGGEAGGDDDPGGCSALYTPSDEGPILAQTWDMHGSATDFVCLLLVPGGPDGASDDENAAGKTLLFTITGCVGMTGLTSWGLGLTINNLHSTDAKIGVVWPAVVRRALRERDAGKASELIMKAPLGSGHHYIAADPAHIYGVETSGTREKVTQTGGGEVHLHTNHCLDPFLAETSRIGPGSTTKERLEKLETMKKEGMPKTARGVYDAFERVSMTRKPGAPHAAATCGAFVMALEERRAYACRGLPADQIPLVFDLSK